MRLRLSHTLAFYSKAFYSASTSHFDPTVPYSYARKLTKLPLVSTKPKSAGEPLEFIDFCRVECTGGNGGDGCISFLREKNVPFGTRFLNLNTILAF